MNFVIADSNKSDLGLLVVDAVHPVNGFRLMQVLRKNPKEKQKFLAGGK